jgi:hypothetical protein
MARSGEKCLVPRGICVACGHLGKGGEIAADLLQKQSTAALEPQRRERPLAADSLQKQAQARREQERL